MKGDKEGDCDWGSFGRPTRPFPAESADLFDYRIFDIVSVRLRSYERFCRFRQFKVSTVSHPQRPPLLSDFPVFHTFVFRSSLAVLFLPPLFHFSLAARHYPTVIHFAFSVGLLYIIGDCVSLLRFSFSRYLFHLTAFATHASLVF